MMRVVSLLLAVCSVALATAAGTATVVDTYHGVRVEDPFRWLENTSDPKVQEWSRTQNDRARNYLDRLPFRKPMFDRLMQQESATSSSFAELHPAGGRVFALYNQPPKQHPMLAVLGPDLNPVTAVVIVDPNSLDPTGATAIDWFVPSPDGKSVAVSMSLGGSEDGSLHVFDVTSHKEVEPVIPRVQYPTAGGSVGWRADSTGIWYTRFPGPERPAQEQHFFQKIYFHQLGTPAASDKLVLGDDFPKIAEVLLDDRNPRFIIASVANGDGGEFAHYLIDQNSKITPISRFSDQIVLVTAAADGALYLVSRKDAPRGKILRLPAGDTNLAHATVLVPQSEAVIQGGGEFGGAPVIVTSHSIYVREVIGGPSRVAIFDMSGHPKGTLPLPDPAAVAEVIPLDDDSIAYSVETYTRPRYFARYMAKTGQAVDTKLAQTSPVNFSDVEVLREFATSKDGTRVPLNIIRRKGTKLDGSNPTLLNGYGGYSVIDAPYFGGSTMRLWLDGGGVYVVANLRGGGEYGEEWHTQGSLTHKQNVFDDFYASAQYLIAQKYTSPEHLAILGGSNGGLLMGAELTQHPQMFRAVVSLVGIYDMMRVELDPNGAFNTTEFGSTKDPDQFKALLAYSPYHHVVPGASYPAVFMYTGANDGRVNPMHSRKMVARLQAANASNHPIYLAMDANSGHGIGSALSNRMNQRADLYAFLFDQLGMRYAPH
jgi:prolyl oligopeptidase